MGSKPTNKREFRGINIVNETAPTGPLPQPRGLPAATRCSSPAPCSRCGGYGEGMNWLTGTVVVCFRCGGSGESV